MTLEKWYTDNRIAEFERCGHPTLLVPCTQPGMNYLPENPMGFPCMYAVGHNSGHAAYDFDERFPKVNVPADHEYSKEFFVTNYGQDQNLRRSLFWAREAADSKGVMGHPAKAPVPQMEEVWRLVSMPGDLIVDIFGGTGTTMVAARENRRVVLFELEPKFSMLQQLSMDKMIDMGLFESGQVMLMNGDNRKLLKSFTGLVDHIITSPPYAGIMVSAPKADSSKALTGSTYVDTIEDYATHPDSIGALPKFRYNMEMRKVYQACYDALKPGGTLTTIMGDYTKDGERVYLSSWVMKTAEKVGFEVAAWFKRYMRGTGYKQLAKSKGAYVVEDEDTIILRKPYA